MPAGRPTDYTEDLVEGICERIAGGETVTGICRESDMPDKSTIFRWLGKHAEFRDRYAQAKELCADAWFEQCIEIADDSINDWMQRELNSGRIVEVPDHEHIQRSKLRVDTRKWAAGRMAPNKYGDRATLEHTGAGGGAIIYEIHEGEPSGEG